MMTNDEVIKKLLKIKEMLCTVEESHAIDTAIAALKDNWPVEKRRQKAEGLKEQISCNYAPSLKKIDEAFGLNEPGLEEKVAEVLKKWDNNLTDEENIDSHCKSVIEVVREYDRTRKEEVEKNP
jgi:hypothetical protein